MELLALHTRRRRGALVPPEPAGEPERKRVCKSLEPIPNESDFCHQLNECAMDYWTMELDSIQKDFSKSWKQRYCPALPKMYCRRIWTLQPYYGLLEEESLQSRNVRFLFLKRLQLSAYICLLQPDHIEKSHCCCSHLLWRDYTADYFQEPEVLETKKTLDCFKSQTKETTVANEMATNNPSSPLPSLNKENTLEAAKLQETI
ncbi:uncharacterized protein LOC142072822 isoform X3 [Caretta caretta]